MVSRAPDTRSCGSRLPRPYHFRARIQSFQTVAAPFPGDSVLRAPSVCALQLPAGRPRYAILRWQRRTCANGLIPGLGRARLPGRVCAGPARSTRPRPRGSDAAAGRRLPRAACLRLVSISTCVDAPSLHTPWIFPFRAISMVCSKGNFPFTRFTPHGAARCGPRVRKTDDGARDSRIPPEADLCISFIAVSGPEEAINNDSMNSTGQKEKSLYSENANDIGCLSHPRFAGQPATVASLAPQRRAATLIDRCKAARRAMPKIAIFRHNVYNAPKRRRP